VKLKLDWLDSTDYEENPKAVANLKKYAGILIPGGFGSRGIEGKIKAIEFCRKNKIPYFGLCYGMQLAVIEFARNVVGLKGAHTLEANPKAEHLVVDIMPEQKERLAKKDYGATMRLGQYKAILTKGTHAEKAYGTASVLERHRHRYEINPDYVERIEDKGMVFSGTSPDGRLMEIAELPKSVHPFFLATQFHPEFQSSLLHPHPLFVAFLKSCKK
jgi:CTP synthase